MPEWLKDSFTAGTSHSLREIIVRALVAAACGVLVALIYRLSHGKHKKDPHPLQATLLILTVLIALVSMVIGESVARAFSLVGALSIVRFRTVVDDTRDTAFVIFAVIMGMASGIGQILIPAVGIPIVGVVAIALSTNSQSAKSRKAVASRRKPRHKLVLRLATEHDQQGLADCLATYLESHRVDSARTVSQGTAVEITYRGKLRDTAELAKCVADIRRIPGVQEVELRT